MSEHLATFQKILEYIDGYAHFAVTGHSNPDGDCIGSCLAVGTILEHMGKKVQYMTPDIPSSYFGFLPGVDRFSNDPSLLHQAEVIFVLDTGVIERSIIHGIPLEDKIIILIDHHLSNEGFGTIQIIEPGASSLCGLLTELFMATHPEWITPQIATYLFMGISTDTGHFMREEDPKCTFEHATTLLAKGADKSGLVKHLFRSNPLEAIIFVGILLQRIKKTGDIVRTWHEESELSSYGIDESKIEVALMLLASIKHDGIFVLFKSYDTRDIPYMKCSFRCQSQEVSAGRLAQQFGGGGHRASAGAKIDTPDGESYTFKERIPQLLQQMNEHIKAYKK